MNSLEEMFISTSKYLFLNDDLASISTGAIPSPDWRMTCFITEYKAVYMQHIEKGLSKIKSNNFLHITIYWKYFCLSTKIISVLTASPYWELIQICFGNGFYCSKVIKYELGW